MAKQVKANDEYIKHINPSKLVELKLESEKIVAGYLIFLNSKGIEPYIYPSIGKIQEGTEIKGKPTIIKAIKRLEELGMFTNVERSKSINTANRYWINPEWIATPNSIPSNKEDKIDMLINLVKEMSNEIKELKEEIKQLKGESIPTPKAEPKIEYRSIPQPKGNDAKMRESMNKLLERYDTLYGKPEPKKEVTAQAVQNVEYRSVEKIEDPNPYETMSNASLYEKMKEQLDNTGTIEDDITNELTRRDKLYTANPSMDNDNFYSIFNFLLNIIRDEQ